MTSGAVLAHGATHGSGPDVELLFFGGALIVLGIVFFVQKSAKPQVSIVLVLAGLALGVGAFTVP